MKKKSPFNYQIVTSEVISGFFGEYAFLSNFFESAILHDNIVYLTCENFYQAQKVIPRWRHLFARMTPAESKKEWKNFPLVDKSNKEWDNRKREIMHLGLLLKFTQNKELRERLLATEHRKLEEKNHWGDTYWGVDLNGEGLNMLGYLLKETRKTLR